MRSRALLLGCAACVGFAALLYVWSTGRSTPPTTSPGTAEARLLRPLAHRTVTGVGIVAWPPATPIRGLEPAEAAFMARIERLAQQALEDDPRDIGAVLDCARRLLWLGNWPRAERLADAVLVAAPLDPFALGLLAAVRHEQGRREDCARLANEALAKAEVVPLGLLWRGRSAAERGDFTRLLTDAQKAAALDPDEPLVAFGLACELVAANRFVEAEPWLQRSLVWLFEDRADKRPYVTANLAIAGLLAGRQSLRSRFPANGVELAMQRLPLPAVHCTLRGRGKSLSGWLMLDCGASDTVLGPAAAELATDTETDASMSTVAGAQSVGIGLLEQLEIGDLTIDDVPVLLDRSQLAPHAEGVIATLGVAVMRRFHVTFDLIANTCRFDRPEVNPPDRPNAVTIPFQLHNNQLLVSARFARGKQRTFLFDSGASGVFVSTKVLAEEFGTLPGRTGSQVSFSGEEIPVIEVQPPRPLELGGRAMPLASIYGDTGTEARDRIARRQTAGTIGLVLHARYELDFLRHRLRISQ